jgi:5-methylcytosine-specific restriction endonuclease McrA
MWRSTDHKGTVEVVEATPSKVTARILTACDGRQITARRYSLTFPLDGFRDLYEFGGQRGPRRMPALKQILKYHHLDMTPACVRCGAFGDVERAHIIDRSDNGLDNCANLAPLCRWCHAGQPIFHPDETAEALAWFGLPLPTGLAPSWAPWSCHRSRSGPSTLP